jgi:N-acetyl-gamma-glutamyl-phosphate reductase
MPNIQTKINAGIVGVTGYTGQELVKILINHPYVRITGLFSSSSDGKSAASLFPQAGGRLGLSCSKPEPKEICAKCDLVFLALPHTVSIALVPKLIKAGKRVIDLSADYRLKDLKVYAKFYGARHNDSCGAKKAVYGLPEIYRNKIKSASLVANPGCYPTAAILSLAPLVSLGLVDMSSIIIDAKSGVSGAGKKFTEDFFSSDDKESFKAYKVGTHQHVPEINQELSGLSRKDISVVFVPHLLPVKRGILETVYVKKSAGIKAGGLVALYKRFYKKEPFVRIKPQGEFPALKDVVGSNFCDIGIWEDAKRAVIICAIDNLLKGASGQAVQNMNIMYKLPETEGLL